uniref:Photosystem I assembly protein Ycf4 n=1 Tax=Boodleopsis sp. FL1161 TaxID=2364084 RepID=A0A386AZ80_9CHLO|nr:photosystem I assembly protein Ycf4 [Boodleopsis sp. FL1161]
MMNNIRRYSISGARSVSNFLWICFIFFGSCGFLITGLSSYLNKSIFFFFYYDTIQFFPQGLTMTFYGILGFFLSLYLILTFYWSLGSGFNEFNKQKSYVRIFRWGFPGKNRRLNLYYAWEDILGIRVEFQHGFNSQYRLFLQIRSKKEIPLTNIGTILTFEEIEKQASALAKFLQVGLTIKKS